MLKNMKRGRVGSSYGVGQMDDAQQRAKLFYDELLMETIEKKKLLHRAKKRKRTLEAEVSFLRQRYKYLMSIQSRTPPPKQDVTRSQALQAHRGEAFPVERVSRDREALPMERNYKDSDALPTERNYRDREAAVPNRSQVFDLNQISTEQETEIENFVEPSTVEQNLMKCQTNRPSKPPLPPRQSNVKLSSSDVKFSICRDVGKGNNQTGKRKISWQDRLALRV